MTEQRKLVSLHDFLSSEDIKKCIHLYYTTPPHLFAKTVCEEVMKPQMETINKKLGQENDAMFLSYLVEYIFDLSAGVSR